MFNANTGPAPNEKCKFQDGGTLKLKRKLQHCRLRMIHLIFGPTVLSTPVKFRRTVTLIDEKHSFYVKMAMEKNVPVYNLTFLKRKAFD